MNNKDLLPNMVNESIRVANPVTYEKNNKRRD